MSDSKSSLAAQLRNQRSQDQYRADSRSQHKETQHVAHKVGLTVVEHVQGYVPGPKPVGRLDSAFNNSNNFRMVDSYTNQSVHNKTDNKFIAVTSAVTAGRQAGATFTQREWARVQQGAAVIQKSNASESFKAAARDVYKAADSARPRGAGTSWDARKG